MAPEPNIINSISKSCKLNNQIIANVISLFDDGSTIPFIARYRKEVTGSLDEVQLTAIRDQYKLQQELITRRNAIIASLTKEEKLTDPLLQTLQVAKTIRELEDIYLPFKPKRRTRAAIAKKKGLQPLADYIYEKPKTNFLINSFLKSLKEPCSLEEAMTGARDILAERINEDRKSREMLRQYFSQKAFITSEVVKKKREEAGKFQDYFDWREPISSLVGHRLLAMLRGENEKLLKISIKPDQDQAITYLGRLHLSGSNGDGQQLQQAIEDGYKRLLAPSLENELRSLLKEKADQEAIQVFCDNLKGLLLAPPLGNKRVMALDPGFRTGAKLVCLNGEGGLLHSETIYPTQSSKQRQEAETRVSHLVGKHKIEAIAIGSGTAGRETESFVRGLGLPHAIIVTMVNEDGASIYSASESGRREFPELDLTVRGSISIGRRLQDPLAELVKIDPKSIGVGQYQHDVNQSALKQGLDDVVEFCVNQVGVELNSASLELLTYVSGVGPSLAKNIISHRENNGPFTSRKELLKVKRLGAKAFEQCGGFLRVAISTNPLDRSAVHPDHYPVVTQMAKDKGVSVEELMRSEKLQAGIEPQQYLSETIGVPTITDILKELRRPGRDPREEFTGFSFAEHVHTMDDLEVGMRLPAIITNVTKFGAFADIGVHQDGLIHISQLADRFVKDPAEIVKIRQQVLVRVIDVDLKRKRIALSLKNI